MWFFLQKDIVSSNTLNTSLFKVAISGTNLESAGVAAAGADAPFVAK